MNAPAKPIADVVLMLEGTYPYVMGGVSAWVDQIVRSLPHLTFSLFYIGGNRSAQGKKSYVPPANVIATEELYLHDRLPAAELIPASLPKPLRAEIYQRLENLFHSASPDEQIDLFWQLADSLEKADGVFTFGNLLRDVEAWEILKRTYEEFAPDESFIDYIFR